MLVRIINIFLISVISVIFALLIIITPSSEGIGTHQQIIPFPCLFYHVLKIPCPSCGLTTSLSNLFHGNFIEAINAHPLGPFFLLVFILVFILSINGLVKKRAWWTVFEKRWLQNFVIYATSVYFLVWIVRVAYSI